MHELQIIFITKKFNINQQVNMSLLERKAEMSVVLRIQQAGLMLWEENSACTARCNHSTCQWLAEVCGQPDHSLPFCTYCRGWEHSTTRPRSRDRKLSCSKCSVCQAFNSYNKWRELQLAQWDFQIAVWRQEMLSAWYNTMLELPPCSETPFHSLEYNTVVVATSENAAEQ